MQAQPHASSQETVACAHQKARRFGALDRDVLAVSMALQHWEQTERVAGRSWYRTHVLMSILACLIVGTLAQNPTTPPRRCSIEMGGGTLAVRPGA